MIDDDVKITINLNKLVETRAKLLTQYGDYSEKIVKGEYLDENDIDRIASKLRDTLTWDVLYSMVDVAILEYLDINETHYGERSIETVELTMEKERKAREKEFKKNFDLVKLESQSWTIDVPVRKKQMALPKNTGPGALTRKAFKYTAPSIEQLIEELDYITLEMGGELSHTITLNSSGRSSKKIIIEYDIKHKEK